MTHSNPIDNPAAAPLTDDEMLDILRRVQAGELSVEQAEALLSEAVSKPEEPEPDNADFASQNFSGPLGKTANGKLVFERGAAGLTLQGKELAGQLFTAHFERHVPVVRVNGGTVTVRYRNFGFGLLNWLRYGFNPPRGQMMLNVGIPWQLEIHGGLAQSHLDLSSIKLRKMTMHSGVSEVELILGEPTENVTVTCHGGVNNLKILRPAAVAVRLTVHGGASNLALDQQALGAVGGMTSLESSHFKTASGCYTINVHGGANNFKVAAL